MTAVAMANGYGFRALDPQTPLLAAKAAIQLDNLLLRRRGVYPHETPVDAWERLGQLLFVITNGNRDKGAYRALIDPVSASVLRNALEQRPQKITSSDQLLEALRNIVRIIDRDALEKLADEQLAFLRDFCVALSNESAASRQSAIGSRPLPSYKR